MLSATNFYPILEEEDTTLKTQPLSIRAITFTALFGAIFVVLSSVSIPTGLSPVPITLQTFALLLAGTMLGAVYGFFSIATVIVLAALGLPLIHGAGGMALLLGPSGGFIWMFPFTAFLAGFFTKRIHGRGFLAFILLFVALCFSSSIVYITGLWWYAHLSEISLGKAIAGALVPFIPGDLIKAFAATAVLMTVRQLNLMPKLTSNRDQVVSLD